MATRERWRRCRPPGWVIFSWGMYLLGQHAFGDVRVIPASACSDHSPNVNVADPEWGDLMVCHGEEGFVEWWFDWSSTATGQVHVFAASDQPRPVRLQVNGHAVPGEHLGRDTGGFHPPSLRWTTLGAFAFRRGRNTLRFEVTRFMPHLAGLVITRKGAAWDRNAFAAQFPDEREVVRTRVRDLEERMARNRVQLRRLLGADELLFIKRITYTSTHYYTEYLDSKWTPGGGIYALSLVDGSVRALTPDLAGGVVGRMDLSYDGRRIVFDWKRSEDEGYRIFEVGIDGRGLRQVLAPPTDEAALVEKYRLRYHHGTDDMHPCYLPDGGIAFISTRCRTGTLCDAPDAFTTTVLYRMDRDGGNLRQLSFGALSEATPTVLPDGRILYTRWEYVDKGAVSVKGLWAMRQDGTASSEIYGNDIPFPPTMIQARAVPGTPDQYVFLGCPHYPQNALGTVIHLDANRPIRTDEPMTYLTPEVKVLAEGGWHFSHPESGKPVRDSSGRGPLYRDPFPIAGGRILVAHKPRGFGEAYTPAGYGLYLLTTETPPEPFYHDPEVSCWQPLPLTARRSPPVHPPAADPELARQNLARCVVTDVYQGLEGVPPGSIRYLRVLEQVARPWSARRLGRGLADNYDQQHAVVSKDTALGLKVQHGVVPVEQDGSAHFLVPAHANIFLQALDEHYLAVQTERTFVNYMPGEVRSCIGCHETPNRVPAAVPAHPPLAALREPSRPGPQPGEASGQRPLHYPSDVQPVLDRHCVECHSPERMEGDLDLTGRMTTFFSVSYENLIAERRDGRDVRRNPGLVPTIGENHPKTGNVRYLPARSLGSHNSLLMAMLLPGKTRFQGDPGQMERLDRLLDAHREVRPRPEEILRISNWVDTNAQFYGSYFGRRNLRDREHPNFRPFPTWASAIGIPPLPEDQR